MKFLVTFKYIRTFQPKNSLPVPEVSDLAIDIAFNKIYETNMLPNQLNREIHMHKPVKLKELKISCMKEWTKIPLYMSPTCRRDSVMLFSPG